MLDGRIIVITGSTSGVGFGTAKAALAAGAKVFIHGPTQDELDQASTALGRVPGLAVDLTLPTAGAAVIEAALAAYSRIDGVVNNAGIFPRATLAQTDAAFFDYVFAINARARRCSSRSAPSRRSRRRGRVARSSISARSTPMPAPIICSPIRCRKAR